MTNPAPLQGPHLRERFAALDDFLLAHQDIWRPVPFTELELPWERQHPELAAWLRGRTLAEAEAIHNNPEQLQAPAPYPQLAARCADLSCIGELPAAQIAAVPNSFTVDVPGRKWQQIDAFASRLRFDQAPGHWLDWCSGKGHLGRRLAHDGASLTCIELDPQLVASGQQLSQRLGLAANHHQQDALADDAAQHLAPEHTVVALHACGDLHVRLLQLANAAGCRQLAVAPCCYNRIRTPDYQPLSTTASASALRLSHADLRLPMSETVTAGARVRRQRDQSMARRLAFDLLQRELRGEDQYLPTPSLATSWLAKPFADYCRDLCALKGLPQPQPRDWKAMEAAGWQRLAVVRNLELPRSLFRRPMELWLLLDRALFLEEQGYQVKLGSFCSPQLTPRNVLLLAER
ncbi:methyltransferase [Pseudomonas resinovorans]|uniref:methyltransferase n=1 Tax=Metapseudomonas resinovorans TaxID=53412 RepID=UPI00237F4166|nr:methyltransferase [Pseudomonas resinovorans]MDE3739122.1 methyltransferase [Pseudomonas resinovorans]